MDVTFALGTWVAFNQLVSCCMLLVCFALESLGQIVGGREGIQVVLRIGQCSESHARRRDRIQMAYRGWLESFV